MSASTNSVHWSDSHLAPLSREWSPAFDVVVRRSLRARRVDQGRSALLATLAGVIERYAGHASITPGFVLEIVARQMQSLPCCEAISSEREQGRSPPRDRL